MQASRGVAFLRPSFAVPPNPVSPIGFSLKARCLRHESVQRSYRPSILLGLLNPNRDVPRILANSLSSSRRAGPPSALDRTSTNHLIATRCPLRPEQFQYAPLPL